MLFLIDKLRWFSFVCERKAPVLMEIPWWIDIFQMWSNPFLWEILVSIKITINQSFASNVFTFLRVCSFFLLRVLLSQHLYFSLYPWHFINHLQWYILMRIVIMPKFLYKSTPRYTFIIDLSLYLLQNRYLSIELLNKFLLVFILSFKLFNQICLIIKVNSLSFLCK